jgi:hypothetical protein
MGVVLLPRKILITPADGMHVKVNLRLAVVSGIKKARKEVV